MKRSLFGPMWTILLAEKLVPVILRSPKRDKLYFDRRLPVGLKTLYNQIFQSQGSRFALVSDFLSIPFNICVRRTTLALIDWEWGSYWFECVGCNIHNMMIPCKYYHISKVFSTTNVKRYICMELKPCQKLAVLSW